MNAMKIVGCLVGGGIVVVLSFLLPFTYWPEMLTWPYLMGLGWLPYRDITIIHTPLLLWKIELFYRLLGPTLFTLHLVGTLLIIGNAASIVLFTNKLTNQFVRSLAAGALFVLLSFCFQGNTVWFDTALPLLLVPLWWFLTRLEKKQTRPVLLVAGTLLGLAFWTKQTALYLFPVFVLFFGYLHFVKKLLFTVVLKSAIWISLPCLIISLLVLSPLLIWGVEDDFFYWAIRFVFFKPFESSGSHSYVLLPALHQLGIVLVLMGIGVYHSFRAKTLPVLLACAFMLFSLLFAFPRFEYFHLIPSLAFLALILGLATGISNRWLSVGLVGLVLMLALFVGWRNHQFTHTFVDPSTIKLADTITKNYPTKSIYTLNGPDQVYFLAKRQPAFKPWFAQLPWYFKYYGEERYLSDFKASEPEIIIYVPYRAVADHGLGAFVPEILLSYVSKRYTKVEEIDGVYILRQVRHD